VGAVAATTVLAESAKVAAGFADTPTWWQMAFLALVAALAGPAAYLAARVTPDNSRKKSHVSG
jgi:hypothetical protein